MAVTKKYKNPPLTEAIFEIFFTAKNWSPVIPGIFYTEIKSEFPNISQVQGGAFGISFDLVGLQIGPAIGDLAQYRSRDNSTVVQLSNGMCTINKLPRYEGWESYREVILKVVASLKKVIEIDAITRVGLKAINKLDLRTHSYESFKNTFNVFPHLPAGTLSHDFNSVQLNIETPVISGIEILVLSLATLKKEANYQAPAMLQLYYTRVKDNANLKLEDWLETAHLALHNAFDTTITDTRKKEFDA